MRRTKHTRGRKPKWKRCNRCMRKKRIETDFYVWDDNGHPRVAARCKPCYRQASRERYARMMQDPYLRERENERKNSWAQVHQRKVNNSERCKRYRERLKRERPEVYQRQLEDARIRNRLRNERLGKKPTTKRAPIHEPFVPTLPTAPLVAFLARCQRDGWMPPEIVDLASKIPTRQHVSVQVADRVVTTYGGSLANVYPDLYA